jgi:DNA modification methylase
MIKPYYDEDGITIYHGDCGEIIPQLRADICVTSPPYNTLPKSHSPSGLHAERKSGVNKWIDKAAKGYSDSRPEPEYQDWIRKIVGMCLDSCLGLVWVNHKIRYRKKVAVHPVRFLPFDIYSEVVWDRRVSMALNCKRYAPSHEGLWAFGLPHWWNDEQNTKMSVWNLGFDRDKNEHPCSFPIEIALRPIGSSCPPDGIVLDPFLGSGTTMVAAKKLGRKGIGIEMEESYCEMAVERIRANA